MSLSRWAALCALGEGVGMAAVALAYGLIDKQLVGGWAIAAAGGFEGLALGSAQALGAFPGQGLRRVRFVLVTVVFALAGYGATSLAGAGTATAEAAGPALWLMALGGAGIGAILGASMGAAQALAVRPALAFWRWSLHSALGWTAGMAVIMVAASLVPPTSGMSGVIALGAIGGGLAGVSVALATWPVLRLCQIDGNRRSVE
ncbi:MAG: hypothetical protein KDK01_08555 [Rhodobacteraceae bacterium]|jgi:hypothetical protein|nr:hypothetical protein [Paracoccaceae bacterium]